LLSNFEFVRVMRNAIGVVLGVGSGAGQIGWPVLWSPLGFLAFPFGFLVPYGIGYWVVGQKITPFLFVIFFVALIYFLIKTITKKPSPYLLIQLSILFVFGLAFLYFRYHLASVSEVETGYTFLQFKVAKWSSLFCVVLMGAAVSYYKNKLKTIIPLVLLSVLVLASIAVNTLKVPGSIMHNFLDEMDSSYAPFSAFLKIKDMVKDVPKNDVIYLKFGTDHHKLRQMVIYVLYDRKFASDYMDDGYITGSLPVNEQIMSIKDAKWMLEHVNPRHKYLKQPVCNVGLQRIDDVTDTFYLSKTEGGYGRDTLGKNWWQWTQKSLLFDYKRIKDSRGMTKARISFVCTPASSGTTLDIEVVGNKNTKLKLKMKDGSHKYTTNAVDVSGNSVLVKFTSDKDPVPESPKDSRLVSFQIKNLELLSAE
jgi:hypothetical protein